MRIIDLDYLQSENFKLKYERIRWFNLNQFIHIEQLTVQKKLFKMNKVFFQCIKEQKFLQN